MPDVDDKKEKSKLKKFNEFEKKARHLLQVELRPIISAVSQYIPLALYGFLG